MVSSNCPEENSSRSHRDDLTSLSPKRSWSATSIGWEAKDLERLGVCTLLLLLSCKDSISSAVALRLKYKRISQAALPVLIHMSAFSTSP